MDNKKTPLVSLIFPVKNEGENIKNTILSAMKVKTDYSFEMIVINDGSSDGCCDFIGSPEFKETVRLITTEGIGLSQAKNLGAKQAEGEYLIFCDGHLFFQDQWIEKLLEPILKGLADGTTPGIANTNNPSSVGYGQTLNSSLGVVWNGRKSEPFPTAVLPGGCFAVSRKVFFDIGGFDSGFIVWGVEDVEISMKMWLFGYRCYVQPQVKILHLFRSKHPYPVTYHHIYYNMMRMAFSHFNEERIEKCKKLIKYGNPSMIAHSVLEGNILDQRKAYFSRRKFDDDWYMKQFNIPF